MTRDAEVVPAEAIHEVEFLGDVPGKAEVGVHGDAAGAGWSRGKQLPIARARAQAIEKFLRDGDDALGAGVGEPSGDIHRLPVIALKAELLGRIVIADGIEPAVAKVSVARRIDGTGRKSRRVE